MRATLGLATLCLGLAGCFGYNPVNGAVKCGDNGAHPCPQGYFCASNHTCWKNGSIADGTACKGPKDCTSGHCADGVCCDGDCTGTCERCNLLGSIGSCTAIAAGSDPDNECGSKSSSVVDGGAAGQVSLDVQRCAGSCDGNRACKFPSASTACGAPFCSAQDAAQTPLCDGNGGCLLQAAECQAFACNGGACNKSCSSLNDCQAKDYCNVMTNQCAAKKDDGLPCASDFECAHDHCVVTPRGAVCCNTACSETGMTCDNGTCACQGQTCANGCQLFYRDADGDGHGDETGTLANGHAIAGCVGTTKITQGGFDWYPDDQPNKQHLDCDDSDGNVFYGQTGFFDHASLHHGFDYNCDGVETHGLPEYPLDPVKNTPSTCSMCRQDASGACGQNGPNQCTDTFYMGSGLSCGFTKLVGPNNYRCWGYITQGFTVKVQCGHPPGDYGGSYAVCSDCPSANNAAPPAAYDQRVQVCH